MGQKCYICNQECSPFFIWTSSRVFPRDKLLSVHKNIDKLTYKVINEGVAVCFKCFNELKNK